jgi:Family of unknown function (DUF5995)
VTFAGNSAPSDRLAALAALLHSRVVDYELAHDSRAVFTCAYETITRELADGLRGAGFRDPDWVASLAEHFAGHYLQAIEAAGRQSIPAAWQIVFAAVRSKRTSVLEDLLFAMTAHIIHDLPLALLQVGLTDPAGGSRIGDFHRVNAVLAHHIQTIVDIVSRRYEPIFRWLDQLEARQIIIFTSYGFEVSRGMAWYNATRILDPASADAARASLSRSVQIIVDDVHHPPIWSVRIAFRFLRWLAALFRRWPTHGADA